MSDGGCEEKGERVQPNIGIWHVKTHVCMHKVPIYNGFARLSLWTHSTASRMSASDNEKGSMLVFFV